MNLFKVYQICPVHADTMVVFMISIQEDQALCYPQVEFLQKCSWNVYTSQNYRILFSFRMH